MSVKMRSRTSLDITAAREASEAAEQLGFLMLAEIIESV